MAHITDNLILETVTAAVAAGANIPLSGAPLPGYRSFASKCAIGDTLHYMVREVDSVGRPTGAWECGRGTIVDAGGGALAIARSLIVGSSNADAAVTFGAANKFVSLSALAPTSEQLRFDMQSALGLDFVGMVGLFPINTLRPGWIKANGAAISRETYARLFAYYGTAYGAGNGSTTFNVPDYRGEFPRFFDDGRGLDSGRVLTTVQAGQNASHTHGVNDPSHAHALNYAVPLNSNDTDRGTGGPSAFSIDDAVAPSTHYSYTGISILASGGTEARPRNVACAAFIRY